MRKKISLAVVLFLPILMISFLGGCTKNKEAEKSTNVLWTVKTGGKITSSPVIFEESVIIGSNDGKLYSVDINTKETKWTFDSGDAITTTPIILENNVVFSNGVNCYSLDAKTGKENWKYSGGGEVKNVDQYDYHAPSVVVYKDLIIFPSTAGTFYALSKQAGEKIWEYKDGNSGSIRTTPSIKDNIMCFGDISGRVFAVDIDTQKSLWSKSIGSKLVHSALVYKDYAYFSGRDNKIVAFNLKDGSEAWSYTDSMQSWLTADLIAHDDKIFVGGSDNQLVRTFNYSSGDDVGSYIGKGNIFSKPLIDKEVLYFAGGDSYNQAYGSISAFNLATGDKVWVENLKVGVFSSPTIHNGVMYFGATDSNIYALKIDR